MGPTGVNKLASSSFLIYFLSLPASSDLEWWMAGAATLQCRPDPEEGDHPVQLAEEGREVDQEQLRAPHLAPAQQPPHQQPPVHVAEGTLNVCQLIS